MTKPQSQDPKSLEAYRKCRNRRVLSILLGVLLGVGCRLVPAAWQGPCGIVVKVISLLMGINP